MACLEFFLTITVSHNYHTQIESQTHLIGSGGINPDNQRQELAVKYRIRLYIKFLDSVILLRPAECVTKQQI